MRPALGTTILMVLLGTGNVAGATDSRSLDDNLWRPPLGPDAFPLSWQSARFAAQRVNRLVDILDALGDCSCDKARTLLEADLRDQQRSLQREVDAIRTAEAGGKSVNEFAVTDTKPGKVVASEAHERAERYWASRRARPTAK